MSRLSLSIALSLAVLPVAAQENPDAQFYQKATESGLAEIDGGMLAQHQGKSRAVISFGEIMVKDHRAANDKLRELAAVNHVDLPIKASTENVAKRAALQALSGDEFDKSYIEWQILSHRAAIAFFKEESASGDDLSAKQFASTTLPTLQSHLDMLMAIPVIAPGPPAAAPSPPAT